MGVLAEKLGFEGVTYPSDTVDYSDEVYGTEGVWLLVTAATGNATATPAVLACAASVPAPSITATGTATPATLTLTVTIPTPTITATGTVTPAAVTITVVIPAAQATGSVIDGGHHTIRLADTGTIHLADTRTVRI